MQLVRRGFVHRGCAAFLVVLTTVATVLAGGPDIRLLEGQYGQGGSFEPQALPNHSVARLWNDALLDAIRTDRPKPPVHARNLYHLSAAMYDAWATYDTVALGVISTEKNVATNVEAARAEAISHAAFRLLMHRFPGGGVELDGQPCQPGALASQDEFEALMVDLGYDALDDSTVGDTPAAIGNRIGQAVIDYGLTDGANEGFDLCYPDDSGYFPFNPELIFDLPGTDAFDPNHWQPLAFDFLVLQNGIIIGQALQSFVGVGWADVKSFALTEADIPLEDMNCTKAFGAPQPHFDPGCPPQLGGVGDAAIKTAVLELIEFQSRVDPADGIEIDTSPAVYGNNPLGTDAGTGHGPINPVTGEPYAPNIVKRADHARILAEFWADGPDSETPPGHWNVLANELTDGLSSTDKRLAGQGLAMTDLEWDVKLYLAMNGSVHDAAIAAWGTKHFYDSSRPITLVRYMGDFGQSTETGGPSYHPEGLPLVPGLIEVITDDTILPGERHEHLARHCDLGFNDGDPCETDADCPDDGPFDGQCLSSVGQMAIKAWNGKPADPENEVGGVGWIRAIQWMPYQQDNFVSPPFPGYTSGHSTFSRAAAEVLAAFTGSPYFPGGLGTFTAIGGEYLRFEDGPSQTTTLQWATFADAADEAGISRRFGGIHPDYDDYPGRVQGLQIGQASFLKALEYFNTPLGNDDEDEDEDDDSGGGGDDESDDDQGPGGIRFEAGRPDSGLIEADQNVSNGNGDDPVQSVRSLERRGGQRRLVGGGRRR